MYGYFPVLRRERRGVPAPRQPTFRRQRHPVGAGNTLPGLCSLWWSPSPDEKQTKGGLVDQPGKNPVFTKMAQDATAGSGDGSKIRVPIGNIKKIEGPIGVLKTNAQSLIKRTSLSPKAG